LAWTAALRPRSASPNGPSDSLIPAWQARGRDRRNARKSAPLHISIQTNFAQFDPQADSLHTDWVEMGEKRRIGRRALDTSIPEALAFEV